MTTYNTGNPVGSTEVKDLYDNAQNLDYLVNGTALQYADRLGAGRKSWKGLENDFNQFLINSQFELPPLDYLDGSPLVVDRPSQVIDRMGQLYRVLLPASFPVNLTGTWATDEPLLTAMTDSSLRSDLASVGSPALGAAIIGRATQVVETIDDLRGLLKDSPSNYALVLGYYAAMDGGGGHYRYDASDTITADNGGSVIVAADGGRWKLVDMLNITPEQFGAIGDWNGAIGTDDSAKFVQIAAHIAANPGCVLTIRRRHYVASGVVVNAGNFTVQGVGVAELHSDGAAGQHTLRVNDSPNISIFGLKCTQPRSLLRGNEFAFFFYQCSNVHVENCKTDGATAGIWFRYCFDVVVLGCTIDTPKADGIHFGHGSQRCKAIGNTVLNPGDDAFATTWDEFFNRRPRNIGFYNNMVRGGVWGFGVAIYSADVVNVVGNRFEDLALGAVNVRNYPEAGTASLRVNVVGNTSIQSNRVNALPNMYWYGTPDVTIDTNKILISAISLAGNDIVCQGNMLFSAKTSVGGAATRSMIYIGSGTRIKAQGNSLSDCSGDGILVATGAALSSLNITDNNLDDVLGVGIRVVGATISVGAKICGNNVGFGSTLGEPYMVKVANFGATRAAICNNTSSNGRGVDTDSGTGSTNLLLANNNF